MKLTTSHILGFLRLFATASLSNMKTAERNSLILAIRRLRKIEKEWNELFKEAKAKLAPEGWDEIEKLQQKGDDLTDGERKRVADAIAEYDKAIEECMKPEFDREHEVEFPGLTEGSVERLVDSNPQWKVADILEAYDTLLGEESAPDTKKKKPKKQ